MVIRISDFEKAGINRQRLLASLQILGRRWLHHPQQEWSFDNPTRNYCYVVTEFVARYFAPTGSTVWRIVILGDEYPNSFNRWPDGSVVDLTVEQFGFSEQLNYLVRRKFHFTKQAGPQPSRRAQFLYHIYSGRDEPPFCFVK